MASRRIAAKIGIAEDVERPPDRLEAALDRNRAEEKSGEAVLDRIGKAAGPAGKCRQPPGRLLAKWQNDG